MMMRTLVLMVMALGAAGQEIVPAEIGSRVEMPPLVDMRYQATDPLAGDAPVTVLYFFANTCPVAQRYMGAMVELEKAYAPNGVRFIAINVSPADTILDTAQTALDYGIRFAVLKDMSGDSAKALGITRTPEVALLDKDHTLIYRGRVNDQFRLGGVRPKPTREDLREALDEALAGRAVSVPTTKSEGCAITYPPLPKPSEPVTFGEHIAPIISKCAGCHREGGIAPFALRGYADVKERAERIVEVVSQGKMPPWFAAGEHGHFANDARLSEKEKLLMQQWLAGGALEGPAVELKPDPVYAARLLEQNAEWQAVPVRVPAGEAVVMNGDKTVVAISISTALAAALQVKTTLPDGSDKVLFSFPSGTGGEAIIYELAEPFTLASRSPLQFESVDRKPTMATDSAKVEGPGEGKTKVPWFIECGNTGATLPSSGTIEATLYVTK